MGGEESEGGAVDEGDDKGGTPHLINELSRLACGASLQHKASSSSLNNGKVRWIVKKLGLWSTVVQKKAIMKYLPLNIIEEYNNNMNLMDIVNQLHGSYQPDRWMRQQKWWWSFFNLGNHQKPKYV